MRWSCHLFRLQAQLSELRRFPHHFPQLSVLDYTLWFLPIAALAPFARRDTSISIVCPSHKGIICSSFIRFGLGTISRYSFAVCTRWKPSVPFGEKSIREFDWSTARSRKDFDSVLMIAAPFFAAFTVNLRLARESECSTERLLGIQSAPTAREEVPWAWQRSNWSRHPAIRHRP